MMTSVAVSSMVRIVDERQDLVDVVRDDDRPAAPVVSGELVAPATELAEAFAATLVARPQTQRTYLRACRHFVGWLGPLARPADLTPANVARYRAHLAPAIGRPPRSRRTERP